MPSFPVTSERAEEEEKDMLAEVAWGEDDWDEESSWEGEEEEKDNDDSSSPRQGRRGRGGDGGDGMCLMGLYLVGSLFGGLCGFITKRIAFREVAGGAVPYSRTVFALDVLMGLVAGMAVLGASASSPPSRPPSSFSSFRTPSTAQGGYTYVPVTTNATSSNRSSSFPSSPSSSKIIIHFLVLFSAVNASVVAGFLLLALRRALGPTLLLYTFLLSRGKSKSRTDDDALSPSWLLLQAGLATAAAVKGREFLLCSPRGKAVVAWLGREGTQRNERMMGSQKERKRVAMTRMEVQV